MIDDAFKLIEDKFGRSFREESDKINRDFKDVISSVYVYPPEGESGAKYSCIGIDVVFTNLKDDATDNIRLELFLREDKSNLETDMSVVWGYPTGGRVAAIFPQLALLTEENIAKLQKEFPEMVQKLREAIRDFPTGK